MRSTRNTRHPRRMFALIGLLAGFSLIGYGLASGAENTPPLTTIPSPGAGAAIAPPPGVQSPSSVTVNPGQTPVPEGAPAITSVATATCKSSELVATLTGAGPYNNDPATAQQIVSLSATSPCYVSGYAELNFSSDAGTTVETNEVDGGYKGASLEVSNVSLGSADDGSFLFQYTAAENGATSSCPIETSLNIQIPNQSLTVNVNLNGVGLLVCGAVNVSPIIQGNSIDRYVS